MQILVGTVIDGRFEIIDRLGVGGTGSVFLAKQAGFDRNVAVKLVDPMSELSDAAIARFEREAQSLSQLKHRFIISVYSFGMWAGRPYIAMEYVQGQSLQDFISNDGMEPIAGLQVISRVCEALDCAHAHEIVHRDVKPSNIVIDADGTPRLIDFGFAKLFAGSAQNQQQLTEAGCAVGTVYYMAPEQCMGEPCDGRSDIYAAGCVLFHCLTGEPPFVGEHSLVVMNKHIQDPIPLLSDRKPRAAFPAGAQDIIDRSMAKDPAKRYQTAGAMKQDIDLLLSGEAVEASGIVRGVISSEPVKLTLPNKVIPILAGILVLIALSIGAFSWMEVSRSTDKLRIAEAELNNLQQLLEATVKGRPDSKASEIQEQIGDVYARMAALRPDIAKQNEDKVRAIERYKLSLDGSLDATRGAAALEKAVALATFDVKLRQEVLRKSLALYLQEADKLLAQHKTAEVRKASDHILKLCDNARSDLSVYGARAHALDLKARSASIDGDQKEAMRFYTLEDGVFRKHAPESTHHVLARSSMALCGVAADPQGTKALRKGLIADCLGERRMTGEGRARIAMACFQTADSLSLLGEEPASISALIKRGNDLLRLEDAAPTAYARGHRILAGEYLRRGKLKDACKEFDAVVEAYENDLVSGIEGAAVSKILSELYRVTGDADKAVVYDLKARKLADLAGAPPDARRQFASDAVVTTIVYSHCARPDLMPVVYERATMLPLEGGGRLRAVSLAGSYLAFKLVENGKTERAKQIADDLEQLGQNRAAHHIRGSAAMVDKDYAKAISEWEMTIDFATKDHIGEEHIGEMLQALNRSKMLMKRGGTPKA